MKKLILKNFKCLLISGFLANNHSRTSLYAQNTYDLSRSTSIVSLYTVPKSAESFVLQEKPRKILIPESSIPRNAIFVLTFDNPSADIVTQAKIYDINGAEVADLSDITGSGSNPTRLTWDGRDKNGSIARSGVYVYQVLAGSSLVNGTVVVAR